MVRRRIASKSAAAPPEQELSSMYDYLAKIILLGPSGSGKTCLLHQYIHNERRRATSQTVGLGFASKIVKVDSGSRRKRIKLQFWDTAGTERFQAVSRSYYRGAAGAILLYDISSRTSFNGLPTFLKDIRALASPHVAIILAGNKCDLDTVDLVSESDNVGAEAEWDDQSVNSASFAETSPNSYASTGTAMDHSVAAATSLRNAQFMAGTGRRKARPSVMPEGREISSEAAIRWARQEKIPVAMEVSAYSGTNVDELFTRIALMILTKIEIGEVDPGNPASGVQYGDSWDYDQLADPDGSAFVQPGRPSVWTDGRSSGRGCC